LPSLRYNGKSFYARSPDAYTPDFTRGEVREVSQGWVDTYRRFLVEPSWSLIGDEPPHHDEGGDGIPDSSWRRPEIMSWLAERGIVPTSAYTTKSGALKMVEEYINPEPVVEAPPVEEPVVEPVVEAPLVEEVLEETAPVEEQEITEE